ncbi:ubiquinone biosynthesis O-methyltransferase [Whalleya microplaca]|nr:ubiquinone biosynthesis O-methyltransferase [Whalleya microplaca]
MPPRPNAVFLLRRRRNGTAIPHTARPLAPTLSRSFSLSPVLASASSPPPPSTSSPSTSPNPSSSPSPSSNDAAFTTVSPDEVSHFNALASSWWDPHGPSRILHLMNPLRHDFIRACRSSTLDDPRSTGLRYLDIGCGGGIFAESAARLPATASVTALDPSPAVLAVARAHAKRDPALRSKLRYTNTSIENLPVPGTPQEGFDVVSVFEVVEHVANPPAFLDRCAPFVRPGGWLVLSTIARTWVSWLTTNLVAEDLLGIVPRGTHDWRKYINEEELRGYFLAQRTGWGEPRCMGVVYVPGLGWREVPGSEKVGNYFFAVRRLAE